MKKNEKFKTMIGGQALIEGIMMRGPDKMAFVVRTPDGMKTKEKKLTPIKDKYPILGWPFIRGAVNFVDSMAEGMRALTWSVDFFEGEEEVEDANAKPPSKFSLWLDKVLSGEKAQKAVMTFATVMGLVMSVGIFMLLPAFLTGLIGGDISGILRNLLEGLVRMGILVGYLALVSRLKDIQRVFGYHGAEHKTIACYEAGEELTVENVRGFTRFHPRCGTSFLLMIAIISIVVFSAINPFENILLSIDSRALAILVRVASRLLLLPLVVAITYEVNRIIGRHDNILTRILRAPGLWMQRLTTCEPDDNMIEAGIESLKLVLPDREGSDEWGKNN